MSGKIIARSDRFDEAEREIICEALKGHADMIRSFLADADGDDVGNVRDQLLVVTDLIGEFTP